MQLMTSLVGILKAYGHDVNFIAKGEVFKV